MRRLALCLLVLSGCDPAIDVEGKVVDSEGGAVPDARVYMGDRRFHDEFDGCIKNGDEACLRGMTLSLGTETDENGQFEMQGMLAGNGRHDVWITATKETMGLTVQRLWKGKGSPDGAVHVTLILPAEQGYSFMQFE
jgi:hypothetical protein